MIALTMTKTLIVECKASLNYFLPSATSILLVTLQAAAKGAPGGKRDLDLSARAASAFYAIGVFTDPQIASVHAPSYAELLAQFARMATALPAAGAADALDEEDVNRCRLIGLGALGGAVSGDLLYSASNLPQQTATIVPALLANLVLSPPRSSAEAQPDLAFLEQESARAAEGQLSYAEFRIKRQPLAARRAPSIYNGGASSLAQHSAGEKGPSRRSVASAALGVLQALVAHGDAIAVAQVVQDALRFLDTFAGGALWAQPESGWARWLGVTLVRWSNATYRFLVPTALVDHLIEHTDGPPTAQAHSLIGMLYAILSSPELSLIGLSTSDVVNNLLGLAVRRVHEDLDDPLLPELVETIGALGSHVYYAEQMNDVAEEITARIEMLQMPDDEHQAAAQQFGKNSAQPQLGRGTGTRRSISGARPTKGVPTREERLANGAAGSTAQQKDESIRVLLYCLIASLRKLHAASSAAAQSLSSGLANGGSSAQKKKAGASLLGSNRERIPLRVLSGVAGLMAWPSAVARLPFQQTVALFLAHEVDSAGEISSQGPHATRAEADASIGALHALAASVYVAALSRALFVPETIRSHPLEALPLIDRANADAAKPIKPDAIASANPIDYAAMEQLLTAFAGKLPVTSAFAFVPMLIKLERDAAQRLKVVGKSQGGLEAQRLLAVKRLVAQTYSSLALALSVGSLAASAQKALSSLGPLDVSMPQAPARLAPPANVFQFRDQPPPAGFDAASLFPVVDAKSLASALAGSSALQHATGLSASDMQSWFLRDWNVTIAVDDSFIGASPFRDDVVPESAGGAASLSPSRKGSIATSGVVGLTQNTYNRSGSIKGNISTLSVAQDGQQPSRKSSVTGVQDLRDALQNKGGGSSNGGVALASSYSTEDLTAQHLNGSHPDRRASKRLSRKNMVGDDSMASFASSSALSGAGAGAGVASPVKAPPLPAMPESGSIGGLLDSLNLGNQQASRPQAPPVVVSPPYAA